MHTSLLFQLRSKGWENLLKFFSSRGFPTVLRFTIEEEKKYSL